jgi:hypothetical protein
MFSVLNDGKVFSVSNSSVDSDSMALPTGQIQYLLGATLGKLHGLPPWVTLGILNGPAVGHAGNLSPPPPAVDHTGKYSCSRRGRLQLLTSSM